MNCTFVDVLLYRWWKENRERILDKIKGMRVSAPKVKIPVVEGDIFLMAIGTIEYDFRTKIISVEGRGMERL